MRMIKILADFICDSENAAENIARFAKTRWFQEWNYTSPGSQLSQKIVQEEHNTDDIGIACAYC